MLIDFNGVQVECRWSEKLKSYIPNNIRFGHGWYEDIRDSRFANDKDDLNDSSLAKK